MNNKHFAQSLVVLTLYFALFGLLADLLFLRLMPQWYFPTYMLLPLLLYMMGLIQLFVYKRQRSKGTSFTPNLFFVLRILRFLLLLALLLLSLLVWKVPRVPFVISFAIGYMIFLVLDVFFYVKAK